MATDLPDAVVAADRELHALYQRRSFSRHLNPINSREARAAFRDGAEAPPYAYNPVDWADEELRLLDRIGAPMDHPLGQMLAVAVEGTRSFILALRDRTPQAFDRLNAHSGWYPDADTLAAARAELPERDPTPYCHDAPSMIEALRDALRAEGLVDWVVEEDSVMSARVLVDGAKQLLRVSPHARFRDRDIRRLVAHEVQVHAIRAYNGLQQPLRIFSTGLPGSLETEEGLALYAEEVCGASSPGTLWRQGVVVQAVDVARRVGFRELHEWVAGAGGPALAWGVSERLKRGLAEPEKPGVYAKDVVYYRGYRRVKRWLEEGNSVGTLYVGKVGTTDPVQMWLDEGLIARQSVPRLFRPARLS